MFDITVLHLAKNNGLGVDHEETFQCFGETKVEALATFRKDYPEFAKSKILKIVPSIQTEDETFL